MDRIRQRRASGGFGRSAGGCKARRAAALLLGVIAVAATSGAEVEDGWISLGEGLRVRPLEDDLWLHESEIEWESGAMVAANGVVVSGSEGAVVVDTPWTNDQTARLLDWVADELGAAVLSVVATHFHPDAAGGLGEAHRRGIASVGHTLTGDLARANDREAPLAGFSERWRLSIGEELVEAVHLGAGHSRDNIMVWLPARHILFGGCAVKAATWSGLGFIGDADLDQWPATLRAAAAFEPDVVIPGHGPPGGAELLAHTLELLATEPAAH